MRTDELDEVMTDEEDALPRVPWAQKQRQVIAQLEREKWLLTQKLARAEAQLHEARVQRDGWQELAERLLTPQHQREPQRKAAGR